MIGTERGTEEMRTYNRHVHLTASAMSMLLALAALLLLVQPSFAWEEKPEIGALFNSAEVEGTFVLYDVTDKTTSGYNRPRAETRYIPASTFKIANTLIGLSSRAVASVDEVLLYKGAADPFIEAWGHDMSLREAIAISNVPIYRELARRIGPQQMQKGLDTLHYGNRKMGNTVDRFWLDGPLRISAIEQTGFLTELVQERLPMSKAVQKSVRGILLTETGKGWKLYGKSGWQNAPNPGVGWWVGWLEKEGRLYVFALNIDMREGADAPKRLQLTKASLRLLGLLD